MGCGSKLLEKADWRIKHRQDLLRLFRQVALLEEKICSIESQLRLKGILSPPVSILNIIEGKETLQGFGEHG